MGRPRVGAQSPYLDIQELFAREAVLARGWFVVTFAVNAMPKIATMIAAAKAASPIACLLIFGPRVSPPSEATLGIYVLLECRARVPGYRRYRAAGASEFTICKFTVTPISRPVVKMQSRFFWQRQLPNSHSFLPATVFESRPFLQFMAAYA